MAAWWWQSNAVVTKCATPTCYTWGWNTLVFSPFLFFHHAKFGWDVAQLVECQVQHAASPGSTLWCGRFLTLSTFSAEISLALFLVTPCAFTCILTAVCTVTRLKCRNWNLAVTAFSPWTLTKCFLHSELWKTLGDVCDETPVCLVSPVTRHTVPQLRETSLGHYAGRN